VKRARVRELESELLNSAALKEHFESNPLDLKALRHDRSLNPSRVAPHLATVPSYLLPAALKSQMVSNKREAKRRARDSALGGGGQKKRRQDPLQGGGSGSAIAALALEQPGGEDAAMERRMWETQDPAVKVTAVCCSVVQCVAVCCSVLQCVAVRCSAAHVGDCGPGW